MGVCRYHGVTRLRRSKAGGRPAHAGLRTNIRLMFHAMVTRCHSPLALSRPRRLNWRKIAALVDAPGNLVRFTLLPGQRHDIKSVDDLLKGIDREAFLGDKAFDAKAPRARLAQEGIEAVIPQRKGAAELIDYDREKYK